MAALLFTAAGVMFLIWISVSAGRFLDTGRQEEGSVYQTVRARIHTDLIGRIERLAESGTEEAGEQPVSGDEDNAPEELQPEQEDRQLPEEDQNMEIFGGEPVSSSDSMDHLKEISAFVPEELENPGTVYAQEKPTGTVYIPFRTGTAYTGESWERGEYPEEVLPEDMPDFLEECRMFPGGLDRLEELCKYWDTSSDEAVGRQIDETFEMMAVYDTVPGSVPEEEDFAEYFLFENHKGFCVHFATTAALLYRMCGYPSVYIEGYAVPASAFEPAGDGTWQAQVEGSMGHAWCQVYEGADRGWVNKEHTPAGSGGSAADGLPEQAGGADRLWTDRGVRLGWPGAAAAAAGSVLLISAAAVLVRAAFRRKKFREESADTAEGNGIPALYERAVRMAELARGSVPGPGKRRRVRGRKRHTGFPGTEDLELLKKEYREISAEEWDWFYEQVMRALYYHPEGGSRARERALRLYGECADAAWERMTAGRRLLCRYVYGISPEHGMR